MSEAQNKLSQLSEATEDLLFFTMEPRFADLIETANRQYHVDGGPEAIGRQFENFLLYEFRQDGVRFIDRYIEEKCLYADWFEAMIDSFFSGFEVVRYSGHTFVKEIFTKRDFPLLNPELLEDAAFVVGRIFEFGEGFMLEDRFEAFPKSYLEPFRHGMLEKFSAEPGKGSLEIYIKNHALLMMRYLDIIETVEEEEVEEEDYVVHQSTYLHQSFDQIKAILLALKECELSLEEPDDLVFQVVQNETIHAELVLMKTKVVLECVDNATLQQAKSWLVKVLGTHIIHFSDEVLTIDDLLGK
jgi:hypothetical protein